MLLKNITENSVKIRIDDQETEIGAGVRFVVNQDKWEELLNNYQKIFVEINLLDWEMIIDKDYSEEDWSASKWVPTAEKLFDKLFSMDWDIALRAKIHYNEDAPTEAPSEWDCFRFDTTAKTLYFATWYESASDRMEITLS